MVAEQVKKLDESTGVCVIQALKERYCEVLEGGRFSLEEEPFDEGFQIQCTLSGHDGEDKLILEVRVRDEDHPKLSAEDRVHLGLDILGYLFDQHLVDDPGVLPSLDWQEFNYAGVVAHVRGDIRRPGIESAANDLLKDRGGDWD